MKYIILIGLLTGILTSGCKTTIPERDSVDPKFTFLIKGTGINETLTETFDFDNQVLYLTRGETYTVSLIASDGGGVQSVLWELQALPPVIDFPEPLPAGWNSAFTLNNFNQIVWGGDRLNPVTGAALTTKMIPNGNTTSSVEDIDVLFAIQDFHSNDVRKLLTFRIYNERPRIGPR